MTFIEWYLLIGGIASALGLACGGIFFWMIRHDRK